MSLWSAQSAIIEKQSAFYGALRAEMPDSADQDVLAALEAENAELLLLSESADNLTLRRAVIESHQRECAVILARRRAQALEDLQAHVIEFDAFGVLRGSLIGQDQLILSP